MTAAADGPYCYRVIASDGFITPDGISNEVGVTVDRTAPVTSITSGPSGTINDATPTYLFSSAGSDAIACQLDGGPPAACSAPRRWGRSATARRTPSRSSAATTRVTPRPTRAPSRSIWRGPRRPRSTAARAGRRPPTRPRSRSRPVMLAADSNVSSTATGSRGAPSPRTYNGLGDGSHTFQVRAIDGAGNEGAAASRTWTVDTSGPAVTITGGPSGPTSDPTPTFTFTSADAVTFNCDIDGSFGPVHEPVHVGPAGGRPARLPRPGLRRRREPGRSRGTQLLGRYRRAGHDDHGRPNRRDDRHDADVHVLERPRRHVPVLRRRRRVRELHLAAQRSHPSAKARIPSTSRRSTVSATAGPSRAAASPSIRPGPRRPRSTAARAGRRPPTRPRSRSRRAMRRAASSASSTAAGSRGAPARGATTAWATARTRSRCAPSTASATRALRPRARGRSTPPARRSTSRAVRRARHPTRRRRSRSRRPMRSRSTATSTAASLRARARSRRRRWRTARTSSACQGFDGAGNGGDLEERDFSVDTVGPADDHHGRPDRRDDRHDADASRSRARPARRSSAGSTPARSSAARRPARSRPRPRAVTRSACRRSTASATGGAVASRAFTVDTTDPDTTITAGPAAGSTQGTDVAVFAFSASEPGATFQCRLDAAAFAACNGGASPR